MVSVSARLPRIRLFSLLACVWLPLGAAPVQAQERPAVDAAAGQAAYEQQCARCHGITGAGDGVDAKRFYPRPRDLKLGVYKFRSTASGTPPTDEDLFHTLTRGLPGSNMPDWQHLNEATRWQLVYYLKSLAPVFADTPPQPLALPPDPGAGNLERGQALYQELGCAACHGEQGRANGLSAAGIVDDWGMKLRPANLTQGWAYRGGAAPKDILTRLLAGIDGAGMPSYAEAITPLEDAWHLAYYVASLQEPARWQMVLKPAQISGALPSSVDDPRWRKAPYTTLKLRNVVDASGTWVEPPTVRAVNLQAIANREAVVFHLTWDDPSQDAGSPPDGVAVVLQPEGLQGDVVTLHAWPYAGAPALDFCYWNAQDQTAGELLAKDVESVRGRLGTQAPLLAQATYVEGRWHLVLERPLHPTTLAGAATLGGPRFDSLAVMLWDAGEPGSRAVSSWIDLDFGTSHDTSASAH